MLYTTAQREFTKNEVIRMPLHGRCSLPAGEEGLRSRMMMSAKGSGTAKMNGTGEADTETGGASANMNRRSQTARIRQPFMVGSLRGAISLVPVDV